MIKNIARYMCDRCAKYKEVDYGSAFPSNWKLIDTKNGQKLICPGCVKAYNDTVEDFFDDSGSVVEGVVFETAFIDNSKDALYDVEKFVNLYDAFNKLEDMGNRTNFLLKIETCRDFKDNVTKRYIFGIHRKRTLNALTSILKFK